MIKFRPNIEEKHKNSVLLVDGIFFWSGLQPFRIDSIIQT
jgi:hypothetical protein